MKTKFLLGLAPLLATAAFTVVPAAAQARVPCWENTEGGACITGSEGISFTNKSFVFNVTQAGSPVVGVTIICTKNSITGKITNEPSDGLGTIPLGDASFGTCTINATGCTVEMPQIKEWTLQAGGIAGTPSTYKVSLTIPSAGWEEIVHGPSCAVGWTFTIAGTVPGDWVNGNPSTLSFENSAGLLLNGSESTTITGAFTFKRSTGANIFLG